MVDKFSPACYDLVMEPNTATYVLDVHENRKDTWGVKSRVYTDFSSAPAPTGPLCSDPECASPACSSGHPEVDHRVWNLWRTREIRTVKAMLVPILAAYLGVEPDVVRIRYSHKAGCSCGCSPGWVIESPWTGNRTGDIWVNWKEVVV